MDWKNQLTKTPYLVLFIVLISVGVGTASALITITLAGNVIVTGMLTAEEYFDNGNTQSGVDSSALGGIGNIASGVTSTVGGGFGNTASGGASTVGGGTTNVASGVTSTVGGGTTNVASGERSTVSGGWLNTAQSLSSTISGGKFNTAGQSGTVGGGNINNATGIYSTVPGGILNDAVGGASFAAGSRAKALHSNTFVWGSTLSDFVSTDTHQFLIQADGGVGIGTNSPTEQLDVDGNVLVRGELHVGTDDAGDDYFIRFDGGNENIQWDESQTRFRFSDSLVTGGHFAAGSVSADSTVNRFGDGVPTNDMTGFGDLFVADDLEVGDNAFVDDHLFLGNANGDTNIFFFDDGANNNESIFWDDSLDRFTTTNDLHVGGKLSMDGGVDPPYVSFTSETHNTIRELSQETEDKEEVMVFWNTEVKQMEVYVIAEDKFYTFDGQLVE